jgi:hypothetical protein
MSDNSNLKKCSLCGKNNKLIKKSHIIPAAMHEKTIISSLMSLKEHPKRRPKGIYADISLCEICEQRLGIYENSLITILKKIESDGVKFKIGKI